MRPDVSQIGDCRCHLRQCRRQRKVRRWSKTRLSRDGIAVDFCTERCLSLCDRAGEIDAVAAARNAIYRESLLLQPCRCLRDVRVRHAKTGTKLLRRQPLVIERRGRALLRHQQRVKILLLCLCARKDQRHAFQRQGSVDAADIVCSAGKG